MRLGRSVWSKSGICGHTVGLIIVAFSGGLFLFATFATTADVVLRFVFLRPIMEIGEILRLLQPWAIYIAFVYALAIGAHVRMGMVADRPRFRSRFARASCLCGFIFFALLLYGSSKYFWDAFIIREVKLGATVALPWWPSKLAAPVGIFLITVQYLFYVLTKRKTLTKEKGD